MTARRGRAHLRRVDARRHADHEREDGRRPGQDAPNDATTEPYQERVRHRVAVLRVAILTRRSHPNDQRRTYAVRC